MYSNKYKNILENLDIINGLKSCRDKKEARKYLKSKDIDLTCAQLHELRKIYCSNTENFEALSFEALSSIAAGNMVAIRGGEIHLIRGIHFEGEPQSKNIELYYDAHHGKDLPTMVTDVQLETMIIGKTDERTAHKTESKAETESQLSTSEIKDVEIHNVNTTSDLKALADSHHFDFEKAIKYFYQSDLGENFEFLRNARVESVLSDKTLGNKLPDPYFSEHDPIERSQSVPLEIAHEKQDKWLSKSSSDSPRDKSSLLVDAPVLHHPVAHAKGSFVHSEHISESSKAIFAHRHIIEQERHKLSSIPSIHEIEEIRSQYEHLKEIDDLARKIKSKFEKRLVSAKGNAQANARLSSEIGEYIRLNFLGGRELIDPVDKAEPSRIWEKVKQYVIEVDKARSSGQKTPLETLEEKLGIYEEYEVEYGQQFLNQPELRQQKIELRQVVGEVLEDINAKLNGKLPDDEKRQLAFRYLSEFYDRLSIDQVYELRRIVLNEPLKEEVELKHYNIAKNLIRFNPQEIELESGRQLDWTQAEVIELGEYTYQRIWLKKSLNILEYDKYTVVTEKDKPDFAIYRVVVKGKDGEYFYRELKNNERDDTWQKEVPSKTTELEERYNRAKLVQRQVEALLVEPPTEQEQEALGLLNNPDKKLSYEERTLLENFVDRRTQIEKIQWELDRKEYEDLKEEASTLLGFDSKQEYDVLWEKLFELIPPLKWREVNKSITESDSQKLKQYTEIYDRLNYFEMQRLGIEYSEKQDAKAINLLPSTKEKKQLIACGVLAALGGTAIITTIVLASLGVFSGAGVPFNPLPIVGSTNNRNNDDDNNNKNNAA